MNRYLRLVFRETSVLALALAISAPTIVTARIEEHEMDKERLSGYKDHIVENQIYDRERLRSYRAYLETVEKELFDRDKSLKDFKKQKKDNVAKHSEVKGYQEYLKERRQEDRNYAEALKEYKKNEKKSRAVEARRDFSEEEELGIFVERPRYDYKKRAMYGAKPKYKIATSKGGATSSGGGSNTYNPPPDIGVDSGYIPPPPPPPPDMPFNEPFFDEIPPPPPPPPMGDFGNEFGDGYIPPPPPPPMFDGEF